MLLPLPSTTAALSIAKLTSSQVLYFSGSSNPRYPAGSGFTFENQVLSPPSGCSMKRTCRNAAETEYHGLHNPLNRVGPA